MMWQYEPTRTAPSKVIPKHAALLRPETIALLEGQQELAVKVVSVRQCPLSLD